MKEPFIAHSEITDEIYIICGKEKYCVTDQVIKAMKATNRMHKYEQAIEDIKAEIKEWYWQVDKQALSKDPCVVDAMVDLFIRTINKHLVDMRGET